MAKGKPYSDAEIRPETPEILRYLDRMHYKSPEWSRGVDEIKDRGCGITEVDDDAGDNVYQTDKLPDESKRRI